MIIYPALDLMGGKCVRLTKGDFETSVVYSDDPSATAIHFKNFGAKFLHVVDLDGARAGKPLQRDIVLRIKAQSRLQIQTGGGIRSFDDAEDLISSGIDQVVLGSLAARNPSETLDFIRAVGVGRITLAADVHWKVGAEPQLATAGWTESTDIALFAFLEIFAKNRCLPRVLCTDISRDGLLAGPNFDLYQSIQHKFPHVQLIASGGVSEMKDIDRLRASGISGVVVGKAIYEKKISLEELFL